MPPRRMHYLLILPLMPPGVMSERIGRPPLGVASATWDKASCRLRDKDLAVPGKQYPPPGDIAPVLVTCVHKALSRMGWPASGPGRLLCSTICAAA